MKKLDRLTTIALDDLLATKVCVALVPVGSVEPHGPHLPLGTDTFISDAAIERAAARLDDGLVAPLVAPPVPYGVTDYAQGFAGAVSVPAEVLTAFLRAVVDGLLGDGFSHVCLVNNHLEPDQDAAVRAAVAHVASGRASVASPLTRRWGRTLSAEYKSGACHAGRYETSIVAAARPEVVDLETARALPALGVSLSEGIRQGKTTFAAMGLDRAYTGAPAEASVAEGDDLIDRLATMVETEVREGLAAIPKVVFATSNPHKIAEVRSILRDVIIVGLDALGREVTEPIEDGLTFADNARIKARSYAAQTGLRCLAEDSGLEVDALEGAPGVHSARYAGVEGSRERADRANNEKLLAALERFSDAERRARFVCAMCLAEPDGTVVAETRGTYEGVIAREPRGDNGFGYDPLLFLPDLGRTSAELSPAEKNARSHRGQAARAMAAALQKSSSKS